MDPRTVELERFLLQELRHEWHAANSYYLRSALKPPVIALSEGAQLGSWARASRTISLSRELVANAPWEQVVEVLRHEMAHQLAHEVLGAAAERPHGDAFREAAARLGVDPVAAGLASVDDAPEAKAVARVRKLLALAGSSEAHEAEAAAAAARRLMLKHNLQRLQQAQPYTSRIIGPRKQRFQRWEANLAGLLSRHFFVSVLRIPILLRERRKRGHAYEYTGTPENLDLAAYVHAWVTAAGEERWRAWRAQRSSSKRSDKAHFLLGVVRGFETRLSLEADEAASTGLVWVGDADLEAHRQRRYPRVHNVSRGAVRVGEAWRAGREAGRGLVLHRPLRETTRRGRLLKGEPR